MAKTADPYRALGLRRDATEAEVKAAHRKLAKRFHPDREGGDSARFLKVQEAYRLLSDPLLRREWDASHAPGPVRATRSATPGTARPPRRQPRTAKPSPADKGAAADGATTAGQAADPATKRPRSRRAYTWSAADVPWWEEGTSENRRQTGRKRPSKGESGAGNARSESGRSHTEPAEKPPSPATTHAEQSNPFDVYNRSSGAAWSMAARAYFRRGDQDLPRRGQFQYEGTQVLTGARARAYAEAEARRRASAHTTRTGATSATSGTAAAGAAHSYTASGVAHNAGPIHSARQVWVRRASASTWPSLKERLLYALLAWIPLAIAIGYGGAVVAGCDAPVGRCPAYLEPLQALAIASVLGLLVALPRWAYFGAMAAIGALFVGLALVGVMALSGVSLPLSRELVALLGVVIGLGYVATVGLILVRGSAARPWRVSAKP